MLNAIAGSRGSKVGAGFLVLALVSLGLILPTNQALAAVSVGPNNPSAAVSDSAIGTQAWSQLTEVFVSGSGDADANGLVTDEISQYLKATGFGFSVPTDATVVGVEVAIERKQQNIAGTIINDYELRLTTEAPGEAATSTDNKADTFTTWPTADAIANYAGVSDTWGNVWTPSQINDSSFGVLLAVKNAGVTNKAAHVDHITVT